MVPESGSWRHGSIADRARMVQELALDPAALRRFERRMRYVQAAIVIVAVACSAWVAAEMHVWQIVVRLATRL